MSLHNSSAANQPPPIKKPSHLNRRQLGYLCRPVVFRLYLSVDLALACSDDHSIFTIREKFAPCQYDRLELIENSLRECLWQD